MNIFTLEQLRNDLNSRLLIQKTPLIQLKLLNNFFEEVLIYDDPNVTEIFLTEFSPKYIFCLSNISICGINPKKIKNDLEFLEKKLAHKFTHAQGKEISDYISKINLELELLREVLEGKDISQKRSKLSFPVNLKNLDGTNIYGQIETFSIRIQRDSQLTENKFLIIPSSDKIDYRFENQIKICWDIAIEFLKRHYSKPNAYHEVVLIFEHKYANLEGNSLGLSITIGFIQSLFKFYNTSLSLRLEPHVTLTGGFSNNKKILSVGEEIIEKKTETVFFSRFNYFGVPEGDASAAKNKLIELKTQFPNRKLKILNIEDFDDLINRRQIVSIERAKISERSAKFIRKNSITVTLTILLMITLGFISLYFTDNNPAEFQIINNTVHVMNEHGKILWSTKQNFGGALKINADEPYVHKIFDIDDDGINEVILSHEMFTISDSINNRRIACFSNNGELIWKYKFQDEIYIGDDSFDFRLFQCSLLGVVEENDKNILLAVAKHNFYPSAIFKLDILTGERIPGTLWSQGHFRRGIVGDFNKDGEQEIFIGGINNSMESAFFLLIDYKNLNGQTPNFSYKLFNEIPIADLSHYFLINKSDVSNFLNMRFNGVIHTGKETSTNQYLVNTSEGKLKLPLGLVYRFSNNFQKVAIQFGDDFHFIRDSLILKGMISGPKTHSPEYSDILLKGIKKWTGDKFVNFNDYL